MNLSDYEFTPWGPLRDRAGETDWRKPLRWNRAAASALDDAVELHGPPPSRPRVFCASLGDWLDPEVPVSWLADLLALIEATPNLDWLLLTKRPEKWRSRLWEVAAFKPEGGLVSPRDVQLARGINLAAAWVEGTPPANVWIGTSVEDQENADKRIPELLKIPARVRFLSCELLGAVDLDLEGNEVCDGSGHRRFDHVQIDEGQEVCGTCGSECWSLGIHWVIAGGESGPWARPCHPDWARSLRDQCQEAGVAFFWKQWGAWETDRFDRERDDPDWRRLPDASRESRRWLNLAGGHGFHGERVVLAEKKGKKKTGRLLDGRTWDQVPS